MKTNQKNKIYVVPIGEFIDIQPEQLIAASGEAGGVLDPFDSNDLLDEF